MAVKPESEVHSEIKRNLLRIGWKDGNDKFKIKEYTLVGEYSGLEDSLGSFLLWEILKNKIHELNKTFFANLTDEEKEKVWEEIQRTLEYSNEVKMLEYIKYGVPITALGRHDRVILIDYESPANNIFFFLHEAEYPSFGSTIRPDFSLFINGIPVVIIEAKGQNRPGIENLDWKRWSRIKGTEEDALKQIRRYETESPNLFRFVQFGIAYGDKQLYTPTIPREKLKSTEDIPVMVWRYPNGEKSNIFDLITPMRLLDMLRYYTFFFKKNEKGAKRIKVIARWNQYRATRRIIERIEEYLSGKSDKKNGLVWQWQGSGKTFIMFFVANWFLNRYRDRNPVVFFVVDRNMLETQYKTVFENVEDPEFRRHFNVINDIPELKQRVKEILRHQKEKRVIPTGVYVTKIQKFQPRKFKGLVETVKSKYEFKARETVSKREVLFLIDEAHRTQYGQLAAAMRAIFPEAIFFGFTGTPIFFNRNRNTFETFAYPKEGEYFLDVYFIRDSIRDGFTLEIIYDNDMIKTNKSSINLGHPLDIERFAEHIARRIYDDTMGFQFKAMVVAVNREACVHFKRALDRAFKKYFCSKAEKLERNGRIDVAEYFKELCENAERLSEVVMTYQHNETSEVIEEFKKWLKTRREFQGKSLKREVNKIIVESFLNEEYPKVLIVTQMLLTGFDAPILRTMYLLRNDLRRHNLLQAVTRVNRPYPGKETGLIVDFVKSIDELKNIIGIYESIATQESQVIEDFVNNFAKSIEERVSEFEHELKEFKKELLGNGIDIDTIKKLKRNKREEDLKKELEKVYGALSLLALQYTAKEVGAIDFFDKLREILSMYDSLGAHPKRIEYLDDIYWIRWLYHRFTELAGNTDKGKNNPSKKLLLPLSNASKMDLTTKELGSISDELSSRVKYFNTLYLRVKENSNIPFYKDKYENLNTLLNKWKEGKINVEELMERAKDIDSKIRRYEIQRRTKTLQEFIIDSIRDYLYEHLDLDIKNIEFKKFQKKLENIKRLTPKTNKELSSALFEDIIESLNLDNPKRYSELSKVVDKIIRDLVLPEIRTRFNKKVKNIHPPRPGEERLQAD
ncbi:type I restriction endonuclease subunit R [Thermococcus sp. 21S7]|uniref:type I restriction endonuclease subunit R n=1 Tax=Thermococcus sp. 21S7 TaxID=1638221 RepID=UPI00143919DF|nr:type I restriction endonuclease subunit R [Thermococcus sp. 21S7]